MNSEKVLSYFKEITQIPRESGHEEHIIAYLQDFAAKNGFDCKTDGIHFFRKQIRCSFRQFPWCPNAMRIPGSASSNSCRNSFGFTWTRPI